MCGQLCVLTLLYFSITRRGNHHVRIANSSPRATRAARHRPGALAARKGRSSSAPVHLGWAAHRVTGSKHPAYLAPVVQVVPVLQIPAFGKKTLRGFLMWGVPTD
eukprot:scaffold15643_cov102-Isochrysis_galbana.AAC.2